MVAIFSLKRRQARAASASAWTSTLVTRKATSRLSCSARSATAGSRVKREPGLERGERLLVLVVPVVVAADHEQRRAALDRVGRFQIGVVGGSPSTWSSSAAASSLCASRSQTRPSSAP